MSLAGLERKAVIFAGGATGMGSSTAKRLAAEGCSVAIGDINLDGGVVMR
jgi:NAD(P)-dependent dehydrogenase (short-subunit alcohol dehydrogenase family)